MSIFKCKMCGGTIEFEQGATVGVCDSCGTKQTLPRLDDDRRANLYDRANHFRRNDEFDKAAGIYERILNEDGSDAEAYWSLVLCRYGIEYVEDPATHKRIPTVNRTQFTSIFDDDNYKSALQYADGYQKSIYEEEAAAINEIQKGILAISQEEEPYDVFICYKETDTSGRRTQDSVLANDLYHQLTNEGFKVFFSRITLEDKLGTAYEPYIFAALNSAKVMVVLGTKPEYFNAAWVKNEWSRYLALIKNGADKALIPAYRDMDPYDLPEEFSHLQAQDMSKLGFMQDLIRGIRKLAETETPQAEEKETIDANAASPGIAPLLKRVFIYLEDGDFEDADAYCERVLDRDPLNAQAYLGKLMAELNCTKKESLKDCPEPFDDTSNYQKIMRFGDDTLKAELEEIVAYIRDRNENARLTEIYNIALRQMESSKTEIAYKSAAETFESISGFKDADAKAEECLEKAEVARKDAVYASARADQKRDTVALLERAVKIYSSVSGWKDTDEQILACQTRIEELKAEEERKRLERERREEEARIADQKRRKRNKKIAAIVIPIIIVCAAFLMVLNWVIIPNNQYNAAMKLYNAGQYQEAYEAFTAFSYKDSGDKAEECLFKVQKDKIFDVKTGDTIKYGYYEQDNNTSNGKEEIEWKVLTIKGNKALVISKCALDRKEYNIAFADVTWENCSLRKWLNDDFLNAAFGSRHQTAIASMSISAGKNPNYSTDPGKATDDKIFLLSIEETNRYFNSDEAKRAAPTEYAIAQGVRASYKEEFCEWWWLRSPGCELYCAANIDVKGSINYSGSYVNYNVAAVRPALWLDLAKLESSNE